MSTTKSATNAGRVSQTKETQQQQGTLQNTLESLTDSKSLSGSTRSSVADVGWELTGLKLSQVLEYALEELSSASQSRVGRNTLPVSHGTAVAMEIWLYNQSRGIEPEPNGRRTMDDQRLLDRFMSRHEGLSFLTRASPLGSKRETLSMRGTKKAREKFQNDPCWPRLQKALQDVFWTDHASGYSVEIAERARKIGDFEALSKFVFGS